jgi:DNA-binding NarL/FixJ family response regulator
MPISIAIVEDDARLRETMVRMIERQKELQFVASFPDAESALKELPNLEPNVILMDINLPGMNGMECVRQLKPKMPKTQVLMLTVYEDTDSVFGALSAGASGYLLKRAHLQELLEAIEELSQGGSPMSGHIARKVVQSFHKDKLAEDATAALSAREEQVLQCLASGYQYKEIAEELGIGNETVRTYIRRIYEKLHARSAAEAVAKYLRN